MIPAPPPAEIQLVSSWTDKLLYMSESEAPLTVLPTGLAKGDMGKALEEATGKAVSALTEVPVDAFFEKILRQQRIIAEEDPAASQLEKWSALAHNLKTHYTEVKVYRSGTVQVSIFIVCRTAAGELVVITTRAVET